MVFQNIDMTLEEFLYQANYHPLNQNIVKKIALQILQAMTFLNLNKIVLSNLTFASIGLTNINNWEIKVNFIIAI